MNEIAEETEPELDPDAAGRTGEPGKRAEIGRPYVNPTAAALTVAAFIALGVWRGTMVLIVVGLIIAVIFLHELGHFVMARRAHMRVTEFFIGFGPRIASFRRGEVEYGIKAIPAGAYVKVVGMSNIDPVPPEFEQYSYRQGRFRDRLGVAVAGSAMHFLIALVALAVVYATVGRSTEDWIVGAVVPDSAADRAGIELGDQLVLMGDVENPTFQTMGQIARSNPGVEIPVVVERNGERMSLSAVIGKRITIYGTTRSDFQLYQNGTEVQVVSNPGSIPDTLGLSDGVVVRAIDGAAIHDLPGPIPDILRRHSGGPLAVTFSDQGTDRTVDVDMGGSIQTTELEGFFGVGPADKVEALGVGQAVVAAGTGFTDLAGQTVGGLVRFFHPSSITDFVSDSLSTPPQSGDSEVPKTQEQSRNESMERNENRMTSIVGAVQVGEQLGNEGWVGLAQMMVFFNIAIGVFNLIPLPPFDGGHVAIAVYEKIRELVRRDGRRYLADANRLVPVAVTVIMIMMLLGGLSIYRDFADPLQL